MSSKKTLVLAALLVPLAGTALARDFDARDSGWFTQRQMELDREYARNHPTTMPGTPPALSTPGSAYGHVPPHRPTGKRR
jgi:hypothetical protein